MRVRWADVKEIFSVARRVFDNVPINVSEGDVFMVAEENNVLCGFIHFCEHDKRIVLKGIGVISKKREKGVGSLLISVLLKRARELSVPVFLKVKFFNPAVNFYLRHGFMFFRFNHNCYSLVFRPCS